MSAENEKKSTWDDLVGELGVKVADDAFERRQPPPKELPPHRREKSSKEEETQATPSDWEGLASSLGVEVPAVVEQPPAKKPTVTRPEKPAPAPPRAETKSRAEEITTESVVESQRIDSSEFVEETEEPEEGGTELPRISGEAARSAFDALFAADAASWGSAFVSARTNVESSFLFTEGEEAVFAEDIADVSDEKNDEEGEPIKGRRRRRRGGRGRGRGGAKTGADSEGESNENTDREERAESLSKESAAADSEAGEEGAAPEKRRRRSRGRSRGRSRSKDDQELSSEEEDSQIKQRVASQLGEDDEDDDQEDDMLDDDDDSPLTGSNRPSHRNLPTWDEAIGVIVDMNLSQRSKAPDKQSSNSSRGRGRGGRRHKKS